MKKYLLVLVLLLAVGCATYVDPATGQESTGIAPEIATGVQTGIDAGTAVLTTVKPFIPEPWGTLAVLALGVFGTVWQTVSKARIVKGAKAAANVIDDYVKVNAADWAKAKVLLDAASNAGATMPDKL